MPDEPGTSLPAALTERLGFMLVRVSAGMTRLGAETLAPLGIDGRHYGVLAVLTELGPVSQQVLADVLAVDRSTIVDFVDELEAMGHARRGRNPSDRRAYAIELTAAGRRVQRDAAELLAACESHFLEPLSAAERRQLLVLLRKLGEHVAPR